MLFIALTSAASAWSHNQGYRSRPDGRSPQVRTLTFPAPLPYLLLRPLVASGFVVICQLARPHSLIWFVCLRSQVCFQLPPDPASRRRPCLPLAVGATNLRKGLSPSSQRPCWAHQTKPRQPRLPRRSNFWRAPERSRRSRRPHVSAAKTPTANAVASASALPHGGRLTTVRVSGSALAERSDRATERSIGKPGHSVGSRGWFAGADLANRPTTRWLDEWGVWLEQSVWSRFQA